MAVGRLDRDPERASDLLGLRSPSQHADDLGLALGQSRRAFEPRDSLSAASTTAATASASSRPAPDPGRAPARLAPAVGGRDAPGARHRMAGVGRREHAGGQRQLRAAGAPVIPRAIEALMVSTRDRRQRRHERRPREDALDVVAAQADLLPLVDAQRARLLADVRTDRDPPQVVTNAARPSVVMPAGSIRQRCAAAVASSATPAE